MIAVSHRSQATEDAGALPPDTGAFSPKPPKFSTEAAEASPAKNTEDTDRFMNFPPKPAKAPTGS
jgi:hypothetical protein